MSQALLRGQQHRQHKSGVKIVHSSPSCLLPFCFSQASHDHQARGVRLFFRRFNQFWCQPNRSDARIEWPTVESTSLRRRWSLNFSLSNLDVSWSGLCSILAPLRVYVVFFAVTFSVFLLMRAFQFKFCILFVDIFLTISENGSKEDYRRQGSQGRTVWLEEDGNQGEERSPLRSVRFTCILLLVLFVLKVVRVWICTKNRLQDLFRSVQLSYSLQGHCCWEGRQISNSTTHTNHYNWWWMYKEIK